MQKNTVFEELKQYVDGLRIVDTHEHIAAPRVSRSRKFDLFELFRTTYAAQDLMSAGMPVSSYFRQKYDPDANPETGWSQMAPYLGAVRGTGYYRSLLWACQGLYDFSDDDINESNWRALSDQVTKCAKRPDWFSFVLKEKAMIDAALHGGNMDEMGRDIFRKVFPIGPFLFACAIPEGRMAASYDDFSTPLADRRRIPRAAPFWEPSANWRTKFEEQYGRPDSFQGFLDVLASAFEKNASEAVAVKLAVAYYRVLHFEDVPASRAREIYEKKDQERTPLEVGYFQDFVVHQCVKHCREYDLPMQIHTGIQAGVGNVVENSDPLHLTNLFMSYPDARFDVFHGGYPFSGEAGVLAKNFPNVALDTCWMPLISPGATRQYLREWLTLVPGNKIMWGGDTHSVEGCYGAVLMARWVIAHALADLVEEGYFSAAIAKDLARRILRDNAVEFFRVKI